jgi:hypothetical protein
VNDRTRVSIIDEQIELLMEQRRLLTQADQRDGRTPTDRMLDGFNGWPRGRGFDGGSGPAEDDSDLPDDLRGHVHYADPTGEAARRPDRSAAIRKSFDRGLVSGLNIARQNTDTLHRFTLRQANVIEKGQSEPEPGCVSCARVPSPGTVGKPKSQQTPWWNPVHIEATLADGKAAWICRWCWETPTGVRATGQLPPAQDVASYRDTGRARKRSA